MEEKTSLKEIEQNSSGLKKNFQTLNSHILVQRICLILLIYFFVRREARQSCALESSFFF